MAELEIDFLALSAHKLYAPFGSGVLAVRKGLLDFPPEEMEQIRASGEQNVWGIAALGKALILLSRIGHEVIREEEQKLTARALSGLSKIPGLSVYGIQDPDSPVFASKGGVIPMNLDRSIAPRIAGELAMRAGIGIRSGCHCAHLLVKHTLKVTPGLEKFQRIIVSLFPGLSLPGLARVSFGLANTAEEVDTLIQTLVDIAGKRSFPEPAIKKEIKTFVNASVNNVFSKI
jgi:selenocysteine lyase/cysteine desulfurase